MADPRHLRLLGGAADPVDAINAAPVHAVDNTAAVTNGVNGMERDAPGQPPRESPHNLYGHGPALFSLGGDPSPPPPLFQYPAAGSAPAARADLGAPVIRVRIGLPRRLRPHLHVGRGVGHLEAVPAGRASRRGGRRPDRSDERGGAVHAVRRRLERSAVGEGDVWVFTDGRLRRGRWIRPDREQPARYVDANGLPILLRPGRTWVELFPADYAVDVEFAPAPATTAPPVAAPIAGSDDDHDQESPPR